MSARGSQHRRHRRLVAVAAIAGAVIGPSCRCGDRTTTRDDAAASDTVTGPIDSPSADAATDTSTAPVPAAAPDLHGPWRVGIRTVDIADLEATVWYPTADAVGEIEPPRLDLRAYVPAHHRQRVPATPATIASCRCLPDAAIARGERPFPLVSFIHGYGLHRHQLAGLAAHWASRGMVVVAADYPGMSLGAVLAGHRRGNAPAAAARLLDAFRSPDGAVAFVAGAVDTSRIALVGHSDGADVAAALAGEPGVAAVVALAQAGTARAERPFLTAVVGGRRDRVEPWPRQLAGWRRSPRPRVLIGLRGIGHLGFTEDCDESPGLLGTLAAAGVPLRGFLARIAEHGCERTALAPDRRRALLRLVTTACIELAIGQRPRAARSALERLARSPDVFDLRLELDEEPARAP